MSKVLTYRKPVKIRDCVSATVTPTKEHAFYAKAVTGVGRPWEGAL